MTRRTPFTEAIDVPGSPATDPETLPNTGNSAGPTIYSPANPIDAAITTGVRTINEENDLLGTPTPPGRPSLLSPSVLREENG